MIGPQRRERQFTRALVEAPGLVELARHLAYDGEIVQRTGDIGMRHAELRLLFAERDPKQRLGGREVARRRRMFGGSNDSWNVFRIRHGCGDEPNERLNGRRGGAFILDHAAGRPAQPSWRASGYASSRAAIFRTVFQLRPVARMPMAFSITAVVSREEPMPSG